MHRGQWQCPTWWSTIGYGAVSVHSIKTVLVCYDCILTFSYSCRSFFFLFLYLPLWRPFEFTLILTAIFGLELGLAWTAYHCGNDLGGLQLQWTTLKIWMIERPKSSGLRLCFPHTTWHSYACMPERLYVHGPSILISHHTNVGRAMRATLSFMSISVLRCTTNSETQLGPTWTTQLEPHGVSRCPWTHGLCSELRPRFLNPSPAVFHMLS